MASAKRVHLLARDTFFTAVCDDWPVAPVTDQSWWGARAEELLNYVREHKGSSRENGQNVVEDHADVFNERVAAIISHMNAWHGLQLMQFHFNNKSDLSKKAPCAHTCQSAKKKTLVAPYFRNDLKV